MSQQVERRQELQELDVRTDERRGVVHSEPGRFIKVMGEVNRSMASGMTRETYEELAPTMLTSGWTVGDLLNVNLDLEIIKWRGDMLVFASKKS